MMSAKYILTVLSLFAPYFGWFGLNANMKKNQRKKCVYTINNEHTPSSMGSQGGSHIWSELSL